MPAASRCPFTRMKALLSFKQVEKAVSSSNDFAELKSLVSWITDFVAMPHKDVGRQGPVCPFMPRALNSDSLLFAEVQTKHLEREQLESLVKGFADTFSNTEPVHGKARLNKAIVLTLQDIDAKDVIEIIEGTQSRLKRHFVERGLMLGEFHSTHQGRGIHNDNFLPLQSPIPLLVVRHMIPSDLPFLARTCDPAKDRLVYLGAYIKEFFWRLPVDKRGELAKAIFSTLLELLPDVKSKRDFDHPMATSA